MILLDILNKIFICRRKENLRKFWIECLFLGGSIFFFSIYIIHVLIVYKKIGLLFSNADTLNTNGKMHTSRSTSVSIPYHHYLYLFVLMVIDVIVANALWPFQIYCAPQNLGITRTWICRLNFAQRPFFQAWGSSTSLKSQTWDPQLQVSPVGLVLTVYD